MRFAYKRFYEKHIFGTKLWRISKNNKAIRSIYAHTFGKIMITQSAKSESLRLEAVRTDGIKCILNVENILSKTSARFFAASGTLLGFVRDGKIIPWDSDIDYGIFIDQNFSWDDLERAMRSIGFSLDHQYRLNGAITEQSYMKGYIQIDWFNYCNDENQTYVYAYYRREGFNYSSTDQLHVQKFTFSCISDVKLMKIAEGYVHVPVDAETYLADLYGESWRTPISDWKQGDGPSCEELGDEVMGVLESYMSN